VIVEQLLFCSGGSPIGFVTIGTLSGTTDKAFDGIVAAEAQAPWQTEEFPQSMTWGVFKPITIASACMGWKAYDHVR